MSGAATVLYQFTGMDCLSCAAKIEGMSRIVEGVSDVKVSFVSQIMTLEVRRPNFVSWPDRNRVEPCCSRQGRLAASRVLAQFIGNLALVAAAALVWWMVTQWPHLVAAFAIAPLFLQSAWSIIRDARSDIQQAGRA